MNKHITKTLALSKADMKRFWRDPTALFFTIAFPLIFLLIFGTIFGGDDNNFSTKIAFVNESSTEFAQEFEKQATSDDVFDVEEFETTQDMDEALVRNQINAILRLPEDFGAEGVNGPTGQLELEFLESNSDGNQATVAILESVLRGINDEISPYEPPFTLATKPVSKAALEPLDYLVSGLMGFAILGLTIFGMAAGFTADKKTGAIARLRATPITAVHLVASTAIVYAILALVSVGIMVAVAVVLFDFDMIGDWFSFIAFIVISTLSLLGIGLIIGGWANNDKQAAPIAQLVAFPMMFLSGVFFPVFLMPDWLQSVSRFMPLTQVNDGLRLISSEGLTLFDIWPQIWPLILWALVAYFVASKVFRWEGK